MHWDAVLEKCSTKVNKAPDCDTITRPVSPVSVHWQVDNRPFTGVSQDCTAVESTPLGPHWAMLIAPMYTGQHPSTVAEPDRHCKVCLQGALWLRLH